MQSANTSSNHNGEAQITIPTMLYFTNKVHHETYGRISPLQSKMSAAGKNVVVTGGGTGIGKAVAIAFAQAGAKSITILGRREDRLKSAISEMRTAATTVESVFLYEICDLKQRAQVERAFETTAKTVGPVDILISNAGVAPDFGPIASINTQTFMEAFEMNVLSALNAVQVFLKHCGPDPIVVNVSSCIAHINPMPNASAYAASKVAALKMMDYMAAENPGLHVVNLQPGTVETEMSAKAGVPHSDQVDLPAHFSVWLSSEEAVFLKGKFVWANWDVDELIAKQDEIRSSRLFTLGLDGVPM